MYIKVPLGVNLQQFAANIKNMLSNCICIFKYMYTKMRQIVYCSCIYVPKRNHKFTDVRIDYYFILLSKCSIQGLVEYDRFSVFPCSLFQSMAVCGLISGNLGEGLRGGPNGIERSVGPSNAIDILTLPSTAFNSVSLGSAFSNISFTRSTSSDTFFIQF